MPAAIPGWHMTSARMLLGQSVIDERPAEPGGARPSLTGGVYKFYNLYNR
jgi:hypothetical protein